MLLRPGRGALRALFRVFMVAGGGGGCVDEGGGLAQRGQFLRGHFGVAGDVIGEAAEDGVVVEPDHGAFERVGEFAADAAASQPEDGRAGEDFNDAQGRVGRKGAPEHFLGNGGGIAPVGEHRLNQGRAGLFHAFAKFRRTTHGVGNEGEIGRGFLNGLEIGKRDASLEQIVSRPEADGGVGSADADGTVFQVGHRLDARIVASEDNRGFHRHLREQRRNGRVSLTGMKVGLAADLEEVDVMLEQGVDPGVIVLVEAKIEPDGRAERARQFLFEVAEQMRVADDDIDGVFLEEHADAITGRRSRGSGSGGNVAPRDQRKDLGGDGGGGIGFIPEIADPDFLPDDFARAFGGEPGMVGRSFLVERHFEKKEGGDETEREADNQGSADRVAANPAGAPREPSDRPGDDRFTALPAFQVFGNFKRGAVTARGIFLEAFETDRFEIAIDLRIEDGRAARLEFEHLANRFERCTAGKRRNAGERFVEDRAEAVNIDGGRNRFGIAARLLGRHIGGGADDGVGVSEGAVALEKFGDAEIGEVRLALDIEKDVARLEISMEHAALVSEMDGTGNDGQQAGGARGGHRFATERSAERGAVDKGHAEIMLAGLFADFVNANDVGMIETGSGFGLGFEAADGIVRGEQAAADDFEGDDAVEGNLAGFEDGPHAAASNLFEEFEVAEEAELYEL